MDYIIGDSVAAPVAALTKARGGSQVTLCLPASGVAAGFSGLEIQGRTLDLGIRALELYFSKPEEERTLPLDTLEPGVSDHKDYIGHIRDFILQVMEENLKELEAPQLFHNGRKARCLFFAPDLAVLRTFFSAEEQAIIARETQVLADVPRKESFGPRYLTEGLACLRGLGLEAVSRASHGDYLHEQLYLPLARKMLAPVRYPQGLEHIPAELYRKFWFKLFFPANIAQACSGAPALKLHRPFHYPKAGGFKQFVERLVQKAAAHPNVRLVPYKKIVRIAPDGENCTVEFEGSAPVTAPQERLLLCVPPALLFRSAGISYDSSAIEWEIAWVEVDKKDVLEVHSILTVTDDTVPAYRISTAGTTPEQGKILFTVELANTEGGEAWCDAARMSLERTGLIRPGAAVTPIHHFRAKTLPYYDFAALARFEEARRAFFASSLGKVACTGAIHSPHADALNDHIVQGLYYGSW